jgi:hypothetical protein
MKLWIFLDVFFNHYKVEVILTTQLFNVEMYAKPKNTQITWNYVDKICN